MKKKIVIAVSLLVMGAGGSLTYLHMTRAVGNRENASSADFCVGHQIAEKDCPWCDASLLESRGQCPQHGVPEALCSKCNPALIAGFKAENDWCAGHNIPESQCEICNPGILAANSVTADTDPGASSIQLIRASELPRSKRAPSVTCNTSTLRVQFPSSEIATAAGFEYTRVEGRKITETILCNAEVVYDARLHARLTSRAPGIVQEIKKDLGQTVVAGETLAVVDSSDLGTAKADYLQAQALVRLCEKNDARQKRLMESNVATERDILEAEARHTESLIAHSKASQRLRNLGFTEDQLKTISEQKDTSSLLPLRAPFKGIVVERTAVIGEVTDNQTPLYSIADTSRMWVMLDIYETDLLRVQNGQAVIFTADGLPGEQRGGRITWVSAHVEKRTRTLKARAEIANPEGLLRSGMFGKATIAVRKNESALVVPKGAVQWEGCCNVVFVKQSDVLFAPRKVKLGYEMEHFFVVEDGLKEGEEIVTMGSFLLKTEILKGSIGAGCCEVDLGKE